eukprot:TRINITY_DN110964_c0_g1_i1.p1 TRINITY_DN110964_c0_g1~~TRINITY_DN110964_c0_g1_i1.p1  ORF type:complete len:1121 (+),score=227.41 TRINITY_DN110964_c0_g1_i1:127-3489(+)
MGRTPVDPSLEDAALRRQALAMGLARSGWAAGGSLHEGVVLPSAMNGCEDDAKDAEASPMSGVNAFMTKEDLQRMRAEMREQGRLRQTQLMRQRTQTTGDCPVMLSVRMRRVLEFVLRQTPAALPAMCKDDTCNPLVLEDNVAQAVAMLHIHHRLPPVFVHRFLQDPMLFQAHGSGSAPSAKQLYLTLLDTMRRELRDDSPASADWSPCLDGPRSMLRPVACGAGSCSLLKARAANEAGLDASIDSRPAGPGRLRTWFGPDDDVPDNDPYVIRQAIDTSSLPISQKKDLIIDTISKNRVTLLQGETGSGKTTQVPKMVLELAEKLRGESGIGTRIVVTQPRRVAAITVAKRVAEELGEVVGEGVVGYKIRGSSICSPNCKILFCTTGVLLRRLGQENGQDNMFSPKTVTYLLVDEVHERGCETDFMLTFLKGVVHQRPQLRVVLMSATMDAECFLKYFAVPNTSGPSAQPPLIMVSGRCYPTHEVLLDSINTILGRESPNEPASYEDMRSGGRPQNPTVLGENDGIDYELIVQILLEIKANSEGVWRFVPESERNSAATPQGGAVLIFMPGAGEIAQMIATIEESGDHSDWWVLGLHGAMPAEEQTDCFKTTFPAGKKWKIIACTNVAETSVTVPDVTIVIDTCRERRTGIDKFSNTPQLKEQWCALDSLKQRRGRAGRVMPGVCLRLISQRKLEGLEPKTPPEMQRVPLENLYLQLCACGVNDRFEFLSRTPDPPEESAVRFAQAALRDMGALDDASADGLTPLGRHLAALPCHPRLGKILLIGCLLSVPGPVLSICGAMSGRSPLRTTQDTQKRNAWQAERLKLLQQLGHKSDHCVWAVLMQLWMSKGVTRRDLCERYGLSYARMSAAFLERRHLCESLVQTGFLAREFLQEEREREDHPVPDWAVVRAAVAGGLFPNVVHVERSNPKAQTAAAPGEKNKWLRYSFLQKTDGKADAASFPKSCNMHPNSLCFGQESNDCPWFAFYTIQQTTKLYVYDVTECSPWALLLFGSQPVWDEISKSLVVGGWARFQCASKDLILPLVNETRAAVQAILARKAREAAFDAAASAEILVCVELLKTGGLGYKKAVCDAEWPFLEEFREMSNDRDECQDDGFRDIQ